MFLVILILGVAGLVGWYYFNENVLFPQKIERLKRHMEAGEFDEANKLINTLPDSRKEDPEIQWFCYQIQFHQGQYFMALFHLGEIIKRGRFSEAITELDCHLKMAALYEVMQKPKKALSEYDAVLSIDPEHYTANFKIGENLYQMKNFGAAQSYLEKALDLKHDNPVISKYLGEIALVNQDWGRALAMADACLALGERDTEVYLIRAKANLALEKYPEAADDAEQARVDPQHGGFAALVKAICLTRQGKSPEAESLFDQTLSKFNETYADLVLESRYEYALILSGRGQVKDALRQLYIIRNSGMAWKDTAHRIGVFSQLVNSKTLSDLLEEDMDLILKDELGKGLGIQGYIPAKIQNVEARSAYILAKKNISGQNVRFGLAIDLSMQETPPAFFKGFADFLEKQELSSGMLFSLFGFAPESLDALPKAKFEISVLNMKDFENLVKGAKSL